MNRCLPSALICAAVLLLPASLPAASEPSPFRQDLHALCGTLVRIDGSDRETADKVARFAARKSGIPLDKAEAFLRDGGMPTGIRYAAWYAGEQMLARLNALPPLQTGQAQNIRRQWTAELKRIDAFYADTKDRRQTAKADMPTSAFLEQVFAVLEQNGIDVEKCIVD